jgi:hypothetical protein
VFLVARMLQPARGLQDLDYLIRDDYHALNNVGLKLIHSRVP